MTSKASRLASTFQENVSEASQEKLEKILDDIGGLNDVEKLLLYLRLPTGALSQLKSEPTPASKPELNSALQWMKSHLEEDAELCLAKQQVYDEYRHCYGGLTKRSEFTPPTLPVILPEEPVLTTTDCATKEDTARKRRDLARASCALICEWAEKLWQLKFASIHDVAEHLIRHSYVNCNSEAAYTIMSQIHQFREDNNLTAPAETNCQARSSHVVTTRGARHQLQLKLQEKGRLREQKKKLEQQRCALTGEPYKEDSSSDDTNPVSNEASISSDSTSNHGQSKSNRLRRSSTSLTPKPILPKPPTPVMSNGSHGNGTASVVKQDSIASGNKLVLVSPTPHTSQPVMLISPAAPQHTKLVPSQAAAEVNQATATSHTEQSFGTRSQFLTESYPQCSSVGARNGADSPVNKLSAARVVSKALSKAMANSPNTPQGSSQKTCQSSTDNAEATSDSPASVSQNTAHHNVDTFQRSQSVPEIDIENKNGDAKPSLGTKSKSEGQTPDESKSQTTSSDIARDLNSLLAQSILVNVPTADGSQAAVPVQINPLGPISIVPQADSGTSRSNLQTELLSTLGTQVLAAALAQQQLASPLSQFGTPKKTKTVSSLLREQRVKSTSPDGVTKSHYVNDNRPVAQILKEMRERKKLYGAGGATQNLSFSAENQGATGDESILNLKQRIAKEASVMKKANLQNTKIKKEVVSRESSPAGSPLTRQTKRLQSSAQLDATSTRKLEFKNNSKAARRLDAKQRAEEKLKHATQRSVINRRIHNASLKDLQMAQKAANNNNDPKAKHSDFLINLLSSNSESRDSSVQNSRQNTPFEQSTTKDSSQFVPFNLEELVFSPENSSAGHSVQSTAYNSASNDSFESSLTHDRSRHSSGDVSLRSRHSSGDPRFSSDSTCVTNNPTLVSLLSPDTGQSAQTRSVKLAALLQEQDDPRHRHRSVTAGGVNPGPGAYLSNSFDNQVGNNVWGQNSGMGSYGQGSVSQGLDLSGVTQGAPSGGFMQQTMNTGVETSQFMPIQSVTEANIVSPIRPQAVVPSDRSVMEEVTRESQTAQRLRLLLNPNTANESATAAENAWQSNSQSSSFVPYNQTCSNPNVEATGITPSFTQVDNTPTVQPMYSEASNTGFNDGFASMDGVRPPKRNLETDDSFLAKRQRHHSDQTYRRSRRVGFAQPMEPLLIQDKLSAVNQESLPLLSPHATTQCPPESPFSPEVQAIMSNDPYMGEMNSQAAAYRSHSVPAHSFLPPDQDAFNSSFNQVSSQNFDTSQSFENSQGYDNIQNFDQVQKYTMQPQPQQQQSLQDLQQQQQQQQNMQQHSQASVNPHMASQNQFSTSKTLLQLLAQRFGNKDGGGVRGDHMISGASVQQPHMRERIQDTLNRILQSRGLGRMQQSGQYSIPNPTPPESHPATPVDFSQDMATSGEMQGQPQNCGLMSQMMAIRHAVDNTGNLDTLGNRPDMQDPLLGMCGDDNDNMNMLNQNAQFDVLL